ncbi:hypothetical protein WR25_17276 [Diploscapter pachys]|uniref:Uncharacterized protein n=1 Tax=Diploscapter pachys TaxID=2018661 RepID=A0A2A2K8B1_9BILA|nr:hypothetical protein WR25_17276 [Diploscapter pachys]
MGQAIRRRREGHRPPHRFRPGGRAIMQRQHVPHAFRLRERLAIEIRSLHRRHVPVGQHRDQAIDRAQRQVQVAPFQRIDCRRGVADRDAIATPRLPARPRSDYDRRSTGRPQHCYCIVIGQPIGGIDDAALRAAIPRPARRMRGDRRQQRRLGRRPIGQHHPIARQPRAPIVARGVDRIAQPRLGPGRIDVQVRCQLSPVGERHRRDPATAVACDVADLSRHHVHADMGGKGPDHPRVARQVQRQPRLMPSEDRSRRRRCVSPGPTERGGGRERVVPRHRPLPLGAQPVQVERRRAKGLAIMIIGMDIVRVVASPPDEARAQPIAGTSAHHGVLVTDAQIGMETGERGQGVGDPIGQRIRRRRRVEQRHRQKRRAPLQGGGGQPADDPAPRHQNAANGAILRHAAPSPHLCGNLFGKIANATTQVAAGGRIGARVPPLRYDALAHVDRDPRCIQEHALTILHHPAAPAPQLQLLRQAVGDRHRPHIIPERRVAPRRRVIVQDQEVADPVIFQVDHTVELVAIRCAGAPVREQLDQQRDRLLHQIDAGRFERLQKPARQPDPNAIVRPALPPPPRLEAQRPRRGGGGIVAQEVAGIDIAVAGAVLQRDAPAPPRRHRDRASIGRHRRLGPARHRHRPIGGQPARPVLERLAQRLAQQQRSEAGAVDEQVAFDPRAIGQRYRDDIAALAIAFHVDNDPFAAPCAHLFGKTAQIGREQQRIELIGIAERPRERPPVHLRHGEPPLARQRAGIGQPVERRQLGALAQQSRIIMVEIDRARSGAERTERVDIAVADRTPVAKLDPQLKRRARPRHEFRLGDAQPFVEGTDMGQGGFADANHADRLRFDQVNLSAMRQQSRDRRRGHPARGPAAHDDHAGRPLPFPGHPHPSPTPVWWRSHSMRCLLRSMSYSSSDDAPMLLENHTGDIKCNGTGAGVTATIAVGPPLCSDK